MRHRKAGRQFGRNTSHRRAMFRALAANLLAHERIETTDTKAKELRRVAERLITRAIRLGPIAYTPHAELSRADRARRLAAKQRVSRFLRRFATVREGDGYREVDLVEKVFVELAQRYRERRGGYTRIIKVGRRRGDNAPMSIIELVDSERAARAAQPRPEGEPASGGEEVVEARAAEVAPAAPSKPAASKAKAAPVETSTEDKKAGKSEQPEPAQADEGDSASAPAETESASPAEAPKKKARKKTSKVAAETAPAPETEEKAAKPAKKRARKSTAKSKKKPDADDAADKSGEGGE